METQNDIHFEFNVPVSADRAFEAISRVKDWWIKDTEGETSKLGGSFTVRFPADNAFVRFKVTDAQPSRRTMWHVDDCFLPWFEDKTEWTGTDVIFDLTPTNDGCAVAMVHLGLTPEVACYTSCTAGWEKYFMHSLRQLITEGSGIPG